jgi:hypothetical protein
MRRLLAFAFVFVVFAVGAPALAQEEDVAVRFYFVPVQTVTINTQNYLVPTHFWTPRVFQGDTELQGVFYSIIPFGRVPVGLLSVNVNAAQQTYLSTVSDILAVPASIDTVITAGQVATVKSKLEAFNIPAAWVNAGDSYRTVMREIVGYFEFIQRFSGLTLVDPIAQGFSLDATIGAAAFNNYAAMNARWQELKTTTNPATNPPRNYDDAEAFNVMRTETLEAGLSLGNFYKASVILTLIDQGYTIGALTSGTTLRQILRGMAQQNDNKQFQINGVIL